MAKVADGLITLGLMSLGLVLMVTPLALWVAWTDTIFLGVLTTGALAGVFYCVLAGLERPVDPAQTAPFDHGRLENLPDEFIEEVQRLHPFIHHNEPSGGRKFHTTMDHLKTHLSRTS